MANARGTLKVIYFAAQLCGILPYGSFVTNDGSEKRVLCRKYLSYCIILLITVSVGQLHFLYHVCREGKNVSSDIIRVNLRIMLIFASCVFITYLFSAITRLIGQRNFVNISRKLLPVGSFLNYHEGIAFSNAVITLHFVLFFTYVFRYSLYWVHGHCRTDMLHMFISGLICETVTSFAAVQFLYFVFTLRRHFMLLNSSLNEVVMSTVKSDNTFSLNVRRVSDCLPKINSVIPVLRDILYQHMMLCDILELIDSSYSFQVVSLIGSKFAHATVLLYLLFFALFARSVLPINSFVMILPPLSFEIIQLVTVVYCCKSACFQVGVT
jgi:hypothetical protein